MAAVKFPVVSSVLFWNSAPLLLTYQHITTASVDKWQRVTLIYVLERHFGSTMKQLSYSRTQETDCLLMQPVSIEVQHHTCPSKLRWSRWCCLVNWSSNSVCIFRKILRPNKLFWIADCVLFLQFGCTRSFKLCKLVKVFYESSNFFVHSNQNKLYPSLCVKPTSRLTIRNITTQTLNRKTFVSE